MNPYKKRNIISEINVTPFVDVMLVLLVVFMIASPMMVPGLQVDLPQTMAKTLSEEDKAITVTISKQGNIYLYDQAVAALDLEKTITKALNDNKEARIFIRADKHANYGKVITVIDRIKNCGFKKIALVTDYDSITKQS